MTTEQLALHIEPLVRSDSRQDATIAERFADFHRQNPWVYRALEHLTEDWLAAGHKRVGIKQMFEVIRWTYGRRTSGDGGFRCNNDFTSRYARLLVERHPEWADAIEIRQLRAA